jgi:hypothetical protein
MMNERRRRKQGPRDVVDKGQRGADDEGEGEDEGDDGPRDVVDISWAVGKFLIFISFFLLLTTILGIN